MTEIDQRFDRYFATLDEDDPYVPHTYLISTRLSPQTYGTWQQLS